MAEGGGCGSKRELVRDAAGRKQTVVAAHPMRTAACRSDKSGQCHRHRVRLETGVLATRGRNARGRRMTG